MAGLNACRAQVSAASCPQAAAISCPRVSRTVHETPCARTRRTNSRSTGFGQDLSQLEGGMNQLPAGFDPSKLDFGKKKK